MMKFLKRILTLIIIISGFSSCDNPSGEVFIEAESFSDPGGWVVDQQSIDIMGSSYLLAHGLGVPVKDARTTITFPAKGKYRVWVRTRDWVAPWDVPGAPGKFKLLINNSALETTFGTEGKSWHWQDGGTVRISKGNSEIALHDLTGFEGRCDAILLTTNQKFRPPDEKAPLDDFRKASLGLNTAPGNGGDYDLVVVGGGMAGCCAAVSAARYGCKVALIQNRPVLGGNNSSEVRVGL